MAKPIFTSNDATGLLLYAENILLKMTQNADLFADPVPDLGVLESRLNAYRAAYAEASFRDKRAIIVKGKMGRDLKEAVYRLSQYVDNIAKGDTEIIVAAGFTPTKPTTLRAGRTLQAENLRIENVQVGTGMLRVRIKPWKHARLYRFEYRKPGEVEWTTILHSRSVLEISGLDMMQFYEFRVSYIGTDTQPNYSDVITAIAV